MEIGNSPAPTRSLIVDEEMPVENVAEAAFFNQIFPTNSGMRFNFDDIREFLHDPLIALIATDLTADENLDNIEMILKRVRQEKHKISSSTVKDSTSSKYRKLSSKDSTKNGEQNNNPERISSKHVAIVHSVPNLCHEILWQESSQKKKPFLQPRLYYGKQLLFSMLLKCFCTELLFYIIH